MMDTGEPVRPRFQLYITEAVLMYWTTANWNVCPSSDHVLVWSQFPSTVGRMLGDGIGSNGRAALRWLVAINLIS